MLIGKYCNYHYVVTADDIASLSQGAVWTKNQLKFSIGGGLLKETSDTNARIEDPNVLGVNVALKVAHNIGRNLNDIVIDNTPAVLNLTDADRIALASSEAGDIQITDTEIRIKQRDNVNVDALDSLNVTAGQVIYLGSEKDIKLDHIISTSDSAVIIKGGQGIYNVAADKTPNIIAGNLILEAARGSIGSVLKPVSYDSSATGTLTARSGQDIYLKNSGDMRVSTLYAFNHIQLDANAITDVLNTDNINIRSKSLDLIASDSVGEKNNPLDIALDADGLLTATVASNAGVGSAALNILSPDRSLALGSVQAGTDVTIEVRNGDLLAKNDITIQNSVNGLFLKADGDVTLTGLITVAGNASATAGHNIKTAQVDVKGNVKFDAANDININKTLTVAGNMAISAGNSITAGVLNISGDLAINAASNIVLNNPVIVNSNARFSAGNNITATNLAVLKALTLQGGKDIALTGVTTVSGRTSITTTNNVDINKLLAANNIQIKADNDVRFSAINSSGHDVAITARGNILSARTDDQVVLEGNNLTLISKTGQVGSKTRSIIGDSNGEVTLGAAKGIFYNERYGVYSLNQFLLTPALLI